ncbi:hypothetical protein ACET3Z_024258 [Daucus carota]
MRMSLSPSPSADGKFYDREKDADLLFRSKQVSEIRTIEASTRKQIDDKSEELRQLVGNRYRDLIDSADSIVLMKKSAESISENISAIHDAILNSLSLTSANKAVSAPNSTRSKTYGIACRVKYLVDTPENIWGHLDEFMFLESATRYMRAKHVHFSLDQMNDASNRNVLVNFPLLRHQWQIVESFKAQISVRSRERLLLLDLSKGVGVGVYADALAAVAVIDELDPVQVLGLFLESRKSCISQKLSGCLSGSNVGGEEVISVFCEVLKVIQVSVAQVGELFMQVLSDMPVFYKTILSSPPVSQLFGGITNPEEEVRLWKAFRDKLESVMVMLDRDYIAQSCSDWLRNCGAEIVSKINGRFLIDVIENGHQLAAAEKMMRETMEGKLVLEGSLEWLKSVFGSEVELPWKRTRELVLGDDADLWDEIFENAFIGRMEAIIESGFYELSKSVNVKESIHGIAEANGDRVDFQAYMNRSPIGGGVWFMDLYNKSGGSKVHAEETDFRSCLSAYLGTEVSRIRDVLDSHCESVLEDLLSFLESPKASSRLKNLAPYLQNKCYGSMSTILKELKTEMEQLYDAMKNSNKEGEFVLPPSITVQRSLFIGRLLFAFQKHSKHIPVILGSPKLWVNKAVADIPGKSAVSRLSSVESPRHDRTIKSSASLKRQNSVVTAALYGANDASSPQLEELNRAIQDLCIRAHNLWISWVSEELSAILSRDLMQDYSLSATASMRGWEETVVKPEQSADSPSEMKISLPSMPSLYITSFLFQACEEIHRVGGHVLDRTILQNFALKLLEKVIGIYGDLLSNQEVLDTRVSEKGVLQILLDLRFSADILSGGDSSGNGDVSRPPKVKTSYRKRQDKHQTKKSVSGERIDALINRLAQRLDPIDWLTYEPYLWENEKQSYLRHAVLFGFFVQLNRMYTDAVQKLPTNSESNIMRCSTVPRFKYLPISAPALSAKGTSKTSISASMDDVSSRNSWKDYMHNEHSRNIDIDEDSGFGVATPFLKSFMQVGSRFGESTLRLGSMLTDGQVSRFGDILPVQAAGLLSSFTAGRPDI